MGGAKRNPAVVVVVLREGRGNDRELPSSEATEPGEKTRTAREVPRRAKPLTEARWTARERRDGLGAFGRRDESKITA